MLTAAQDMQGRLRKSLWTATESRIGTGKSLKVLFFNCIYMGVAGHECKGPLKSEDVRFPGSWSYRWF